MEDIVRMVTDIKNETTPTTTKPPPHIHEDQIFGHYSHVDDVLDNYGADVNEPYIWAVTGVRGGGKSVTLAYYCVRALAMGLPVFANFPVRFIYLQHRKDAKLLESRPLLFKELLTLDESFMNSFIAIDEYQDWANALNFNTTQNKLLNSVWAQIRKLDMSFMYAAKKMRWIDLRTREETDIEIHCQDAKRNPEYRRMYDKGEKIFQDYIDWSGNWTGKDYEDYPVKYLNTFNALPFWNAYNTRERFDIFEALRGYKLDLEKTVITDKNEQFNIELEEERCKALFRESPRWKSSEFFQTLGIENNVQKSRISKLLKDIGIIERYSAGMRHFIFTGAYKDDGD